MKKTVEEYLALGMDEKTARYFAAGRRRIVCANPRKDHKVLLKFDNGEERILDCSDAMVEGSVFNKVSAPEDFARVMVDENGNLAWDIDPSVDSSLVWNNRIDFCRDACYLQSVPAPEGGTADV